MAKECFGYPSQRAAVESLHRKGIASSDISKMTGVPINSITRVVQEYRVRTGHIINTQKRGEPCKAMIASEQIKDYAYYNWKKARAGARDALRAIEFGPEA